MWGLFRDDDALEANRGALERIGDAASAEELRLNEAMLLTHIGRPLDALALLDEIGEVERRVPARSAGVRRAPCAGCHGALRDGCRRRRAAFAEHAEFPSRSPCRGRVCT